MILRSIAKFGVVTTLPRTAVRIPDLIYFEFRLEI
jgi:hypothetical protein